MSNRHHLVEGAIRHFWKTRDDQSRNQGTSGGGRDRGSRTAVTGGGHLDGFVKLLRRLLLENGVPDAQVFSQKRDTNLPGYFRSEKQWDLVVVLDNMLLATVEFKSQVGSFGNNFNNRTEEALGNATDLWAAYREGAFKPSARPWLGFLMLLEDAEGSRKPVRVRQTHFPVFKEFLGASYAKRYEILMLKLLRERLYDGACLILSGRVDGKSGRYSEPEKELSFDVFAASLAARVLTAARTKE